MSKSKLDGPLFNEAQQDIATEARGILPAVGESQKHFPKEYQATRELLSAMSVDIPDLMLSVRQAEKISEMLHSDDEGLTAIQEVLSLQPVNALTLASLIRLERQRTAKKGANTRHDKPGQSRDKQREIRELWASGKYSTRDVCAEQECAALEVSFSTARKALRNTPEPSSRC